MRLEQKTAFLLRMILTTYGLESFPAGETHLGIHRLNGITEPAFIHGLAKISHTHKSSLKMLNGCLQA